jgi:hypothetical protein
MRKPRLPFGLAASIGLAALLGACASNLVNPQVPPPGSPDFQLGYINGCNSGFTDAGWDGWEAMYAKDAQLYANNPEYRKGWDQGHQACYVEGISYPRSISDRGGSPSVGF